MHGDRPKLMPDDRFDAAKGCLLGVLLGLIMFTVILAGILTYVGP